MLPTPWSQGGVLLCGDAAPDMREELPGQMAGVDAFLSQPA